MLLLYTNRGVILENFVGFPLGLPSTNLHYRYDIEVTVVPQKTNTIPHF